MEETVNSIESLLERTSQFSKTSFELMKLKALDKTAVITSTFISRFLLVSIVSIFVLTLNIALALWLGELLGKNYYGFLVVASFYGLTGIILFLMHPFIKKSLRKSIITQLFN